MTRGTLEPMANRRSSSLFRSEALEHYARQRGLGDVLRAAPRWTKPAFWALLGLLALGLLASLLIQVGDDASGPARVQGDGRTVEAVLPDAARAPLSHGQAMDVELASGQRVAVRVSVQDIQPLDTATALHMFGADALSSLLASSTSLVLVRGDLPAPLSAGQTGELQASVQIRSEPLLTTVLSGFAPTSGGE
jgi:hypothetical protein